VHRLRSVGQTRAQYAGKQESKTEYHLAVRGQWGGGRTE
jgi:hypothetical protein